MRSDALLAFNRLSDTKKSHPDFWDGLFICLSHGRGFSVVAEEVRTLAHRSASAAREIKDLIVDSLQRVEHGSTLATHAGTAMWHVVGHVESVATLIEQISSSSDAQSRDVNQFSQGMGKMDAMLERDVQNVRGVASASASLCEEARTLRVAQSLGLGR
jgi:methyl-accepting chemotaxis protein